jgi:hypothetical protein
MTPQNTKPHSKVYMVSISRGPLSNTIFMYRTDGSEFGGGLRMYKLNNTRLTRLLTAMVNTACRENCMIRHGKNSTFWTLLDVIPQQRRLYFEYLDS